MVNNPLRGLGIDERRKLILRELDVHGGSPGKTARSLGISITLLQWEIDRAGLRGEAKQARDRWARMFTLGGKDGASDEA